MRIVILEDEVLFSNDLVSKLKLLEYPERDITVLSSLHEAFEWFGQNPSPGLLFADIHLTDGIAFDLFKKYNITCPVIFTTAFSEFAIQAFDVNSIAYLLKPISLYELEKALSKLDSIANAAKISSLQNAFHPKPAYSERIFIDRGNEYVPILINDIVGICSSEKIVTIHTKDKQSRTVNISLKDFESKLDPKLFKRISRQWIINLSCIDRLYCTFFGKAHISLLGGIDIEIPKEKYNEILGYLKL